MYKKTNLPEKDDLLVCTVREASPSSVFVLCDEYENLQGMIHISEIARKQVRAMKVYLKPQTQVVCKVMSVDTGKRYVELSLRRVGEGQKRTKLQQWKNENIANDILEVFAKQTGLTTKQVYDKVGNKLIENYGALYGAFMEIAQKDIDLTTKVQIDRKLAEQLTAMIKKRITLPKTELIGEIIMTSAAENGLSVVKNAAKMASDIVKKHNAKLEIKYISAPKYKFSIESPNAKSAEEAFKSLKLELSKYMSNNFGSFQATLTD
jgi:translation initiation factor 2 subunit 1